MSNIKVVVQDANNIVCEVTPVPMQQIAISRGVAGRGVADVTAIEINNSLYLQFTFTDGTTETVGPVGTIQYIGAAPIVVTGSTISLSTVPVNLGGTGQTTANAGFNALAPSQVTNAGKYLKTDGTNTAWDLLDISTGDITGTLPVTNGGTGATTASNARTNLAAAASATTISAGTGLSGGGDLSANRTLSIANTGVTAGSYGSTSKTLTANVNAQGQLTSLSASDIAIANTQVSGLGTASTLNAGVALGVATLDAGGTVPLSQIPASIQGGVSYQGSWNASTNTPTLTSSVGTKGYYYVVSVAGSTNLNGITDWLPGDWAIYNGTAWQKIDNTDSVASVNGYTGAVVLTYSDVGAPPTARTISAGTGLSGGGDLSANRTISLANTTVTAAAYGSASKTLTATVNAQGQLTALAASDIAIANTQVSGLGTMSTQNANSVSITGGSITGITDLAIADGGTGQSTAAAAITALTGTQIAGRYLRSDGTNAFLSAIQAGDVPTLNQNTTGTAANITATSNSTLTTLSALSLPGSQVSGNISGNAANVTGTVAIANGGTGQTTQAAAITALAGTQSAGKYLRSDGTNTLLASIVAADVPTLNQNTTGTAENVTGTVAIANGGTGQTTANAAFNALAPSQATNAGKYLTTDGTNTSWATNPLGTVTSVDVSGGTTGLTTSGGPVTTSGTITLAGTLAAANGGTGQSSYAIGDLLYASTTTALSKLADVATGNALISGGVGAAPTYGKIGLATHVSGTLPTANGGTGLTSFTANGVVYASSTSALTTGSALTFDGTNLTLGANTFVVKNATGDSNGLRIYQAASDVSSIFNFYNGAIAFGVNNSEQMRLTSTGLGIGTSSPYSKLSVEGDINLHKNANNTIVSYTGAAYTNLQYDAATHKFFVSGSTAATIDSSGNLGIGTSSPSSKLHVYNGSGTNAVLIVKAENQFVNQTASFQTISSVRTWDIGQNISDSSTGSLEFYDRTGAATRMRLDTSGNLGLGVTPSAWQTNFKSFEVGVLGNGISSSTANKNLNITQGAYNDANATASWAYSNSTTLPVRYTMSAGGQHQWSIAPVGTIGTPCTFTQAMTLDASGNLLVGATSSAGARLNLQASASNGYAIWTANDPTLNYSQFYFGGTATGGYQFIRSDGRSGGWLAFGTSDTERARIDSSGNLLVGTTSTSGSVNNVQTIAGGIFKTASGSTSVANATATTLATLLNQGQAVYMVTAGIAAAGSPTLYSTVAIVSTQGTATNTTTIQTGTNIVLSMSGLNLQVTQTAGTTYSIAWTILRIA